MTTGLWVKSSQTYLYRHLPRVGRYCRFHIDISVQRLLAESTGPASEATFTAKQHQDASLSPTRFLSCEASFSMLVHPDMSTWAKNLMDKHSLAMNHWSTWGQILLRDFKDTCLKCFAVNLSHLRHSWAVWQVHNYRMCRMSSNAIELVSSICEVLSTAIHEIVPVTSFWHQNQFIWRFTKCDAKICRPHLVDDYSASGIHLQLTVVTYGMHSCRYCHEYSPPLGVKDTCIRKGWRVGI